MSKIKLSKTDKAWATTAIGGSLLSLVGVAAVAIANGSNNLSFAGYISNLLVTASLITAGLSIVSMIRIGGRQRYIFLVTFLLNSGIFVLARATYWTSGI